ncbi:FxSxx-COOH system tetratricopeptide repeat protein [Streptosporangium sp. NPDC006007]|uniref:FxSxx-COOH system tetratricopeptide repeat protein n=1 Tax=Streptosporangium sp. NPDC006007 TaxID=3154575 RepID=UPI0033B2BCD5
MSEESATATSATVIAFHSRRSGVGRSIALCNLALILAADGQRVLILDGGPDASGVSDYLADFLPDRTLPTISPEAGLGGAVRADLDLCGRIDALRLPSGGEATAGETARLREELTGGSYDYVLLDAPEGGTPRAERLTAELADTVVMCFTMTRKRIEEAAREAAGVRAAASRDLDVLPLATRVETGVAGALARARELVGTYFTGTLPYLEIPYVANHYFSESPVVLSEFPGGRGVLRGAYERLAAVLTRGRVAPLGRVSVLYPPRHRVWAEWLVAQSALYGLRADAVNAERFSGLSPEPGHRVFVVSPADITEAALGRLRRTSGAVMVRVGGEPIPSGLTRHRSLDLSGLKEEEATAVLRAALGIGPTTVSRRFGVGGIRFPDSDRTLARMPSPDRPFVGRDAMLEELRDFLGPDSSGCAVLVGQGGAGKTEVALEYSRRFMAGYDLVSWLDGSSAEALRTGLTRLASDLNIPRHGDLVEAVRAHLATDGPSRWLLICDDVHLPSDVQELLPIPAQGGGLTGHVLVTSRSGDWRLSSHPAAFRTIEVGPMETDEAVELLRERVESIPRREAVAVVETLAGLPLAVDLAGAWLAGELVSISSVTFMAGSAVTQAVDRFVTVFQEKSRRRTPLKDEHPLAYRVTVSLVIEALEGGIARKAGTWLLEACACMSPRGVDLALLRSPQMLAALAAVDRRVEEPVMVDAILHETDRYGLLRADLGRGRPVRMHRVVQEVVRARMSAAEHAERRRELSGILADHVPRYVDGLDAWARSVFDETGGHLKPLGALADSRPPVRRWALNQIGYLYSLGDRASCEQAYELAEQARAAWSESRATPLINQLLVVLARLNLQLGRPEETVRLAKVALPGLIRDLGKDHYQVLTAEGTYASGLRAVGDFDLAYDRSDVALRGLRKLFGADHPAVGRAMNNLAVSTALIGHPHEALRVARERFERRIAVFGRDDRQAWGTGCNIAYYLREIGDLAGSRELLAEAVQRLTWLGSLDDLDVLRALSGMAITQRRIGQAAAALDRDTTTVESLRTLFGPDHIATLTCAVSWNADHHALGNRSQAVEGARRSLRDFERVMGGDHPFTHICRMNLGVYLRAAGELVESQRCGRTAYDGLMDRLGPLHPLVLAAAANHAGTLAEQRSEERALALEQRALEGFAALFGESHNTVKAIRENMRGTRSGVGDGRTDIDVEVPGY